MIFGKEFESGKDFLAEQGFVLAGLSRVRSCGHVFKLDLPTPPAPPLELIDREIVQDRKDPAARIVRPPQAPVGDHLFQTILNDVVGRLRVAAQAARISPQRRYHRFHLGDQIVHNRIPFGKADRPDKGRSKA